MRKLRFTLGCIGAVSLALLSVLGMLGGRCDRGSPTIPTLILPDTTQRFTPTNVYLVSYHPSGDSICFHLDWGDGTADTTDALPSGDTATARHKWDEAGTFVVRARAVTACDPARASDWTADSLFVGVLTNQPPSLTLDTPDTVLRGHPAYLVLSVFDPDGDSVSVRLNCYDSITDWSPFSPSGPVELWFEYPGRDTWRLQAQARDIYGALSDWTSADFIEVVDSQATRKWLYPASGIDWGCPAIGDDGTVFLTSSNEHALYAVRPDGTLWWTYETGEGSRSSPALADDGTIVFGSFDGIVHAVNPDGSPKWTFAAGVRIDGSSPAVAPDGTIYIGCCDAHLYALNPDGSLKWRFLAGDEILSSPAVGTDGTVYVVAYAGYVYAVTPEGTMKWRYQTEFYSTCSPAIGADGTVYVGAEDAFLYALDPVDGSLKWRYETRSDVREGPAIAADGTVYLGSGDGNLYAFRPDGTVKWQYDTERYIVSSPAIAANGNVYVGSGDHCLHAVAPSGTRAWFYDTGGDVRTSPAIGADGTVYIGTVHGLCALEVDSPLADASWPKFRCSARNTGRSGP